MEGDCKMEAQPLKNYTSLRNKKSCREICDAEPDCNYYIYDKNLTCTLYPNAKKSCISFIGTVDGQCRKYIEW